ncbi:ATP-binding protein [Polaromonas hydrogenivorans]|uniref:histidine kinase n=1 Tax=Polaromonas hydrogenivorans TaxID=335476 RepID=A0AAU7LYE2_9BURK
MKTIAAVLKRELSHATAPHILFPAIAVLVLAVMWGMTLNLIRVERAAAERAAAVSSREFAETYEAQVVRALREIDQNLKFVKYAYELRDAQGLLQELKARTLLPPELLFVISIADRTGDVVASTRAPEVPNIADQNIFQTQRQRDSFAMGRAHQSKGSGEWKLQFSRRLNAADGSFSGIVMLTVDAVYFVSVYESSKLGVDGVLGILGTDGVFRARQTGEKLTAGDMVDYATLVPATNEAQSEAKLSTNTWDGVQRYTSTRQLYDFPVAVVVGLSADEQLATTRQDMETYLWRTGRASLLVILIVAVLGYLSRQLQKSRAQLLTAARQAGMAEIATNVLHNVGNVLNSVNISAGLINTRLRNSKLKGLARAVSLMDEHAGDLGEFLTRDARGKLLPTYLRELAPALELEHQAMADELGVLGKSVDHIKEVIATQQSYAGAPRFMESVRLSDLVDDALRMNEGALTRHKVEVVKELAKLPALPLDRNRLLQILVNLIDNAKHAMHGAPGHKPCITLAAALANEHVLRITVADNGEGIVPDNLTRIFSHGFTTRKNGHGFGLHSCVLAAQEMGGSLTAHSGGPGQGATFTLELPIDTAQGAS